MQKTSQSHFVAKYLPWLLGLAAVLLYATTTNFSISFSNLAARAQIAGWEWRPLHAAPLYYLLTYPIRWLPSDFQLVGLNLFSVLCASLSLAFLARSVALLPYDRTRDQRQRENEENSFLSIRTAWIPPIAAVLILALQLTFWEHATHPSAETLDLLLFAYIIWSLLEYRVDHKESRLYRVAVIYGLGITNNWALIGFFPAFLIAIVWTKGLSFFRVGFIVRMVLFGLAGLLLYLALPLIHSQSSIAEVGFFESLRANLAFQKGQLLGFPRLYVFLLSLVSVLPVFLLAIRWPSSFGDISSAGFMATNLMLHVMHAAFLVVCIYVAFDPPFSARQLVPWNPFLTFSYLAALSIGYFIGYFLLIFGEEPGRKWERPGPARRLLNKVIVVILWLGVIAVPAKLVYQNFPEIQKHRSKILERHGNFMAQSLPPGGGLILSDDNVRLHAVRSALAPAIRAKYLFIDTVSLPEGGYHRYLSQRYPERWPRPPLAGEDAYGNVSLQRLIRGRVAVEQIYYLHPSFGYYFEELYLKPHGLVYQLLPYPTNSVAAPPLTPAEIQEQDQFWKELDKLELASLKAAIKQRGPEEKESHKDFHWMGVYYSRALNYMGVELHRAQQFDRATNYFAEALALNPENPAAFLNREWNQTWREQRKLIEKFSDEAMKKLSPYGGNWELVLSFNGPVDEPTFAGELMQVLARGNLHRQAAQEALRVLTYSPTNYLALKTLAHLYVQLHLPDRGLELVNKMRSQTFGHVDQQAKELDVALIEAAAAFAKRDLAQAEKLLLAAQAKYPEAEEPFGALASVYLAQRRYATNEAQSRALMTNAMAVLEKQIQLQPKNLNAFVSLGGLAISLNDYERSLKFLDRAVELEPNNAAALLNRAIANLQSKRWDAARRDYLSVQAVQPKLHQVYYGLGEVAFQKNLPKEAIAHYKLYLQYAPANSAERRAVEARVKKLKG